MIRAFLALLFISGTALAEDGHVEVLKLPPRGIPVAQAIALHTRLFGGDAVVAGPTPRTLVIRDSREGVARFRSILEMLDFRADARVFVRPVRSRSPSELAGLVDDLGAFVRKVRLVPDDRSSTLVVMATLADYRALDRLLARLDVPTF